MTTSKAKKSDIKFNLQKSNTFRKKLEKLEEPEIKDFLNKKELKPAKLQAVKEEAPESKKNKVKEKIKAMQEYDLVENERTLTCKIGWEDYEYLTTNILVRYYKKRKNIKDLVKQYVLEGIQRDKKMIES